MRDSIGGGTTCSVSSASGPVGERHRCPAAARAPPHPPAGNLNLRKAPLGSAASFSAPAANLLILLLIRFWHKYAPAILCGCGWGWLC